MFLCYGSLNLDYVFNIPHFVNPGETLSATQMNIFCGGKGLNQSIALAKAGAKVFHGGKVGNDGDTLLCELKRHGVDISHVVVDPNQKSGNAMIQVDAQGQNCILLWGGTNQNITTQEMTTTLSYFGKGDWLVLQNEINNISHIMLLAKQRGLNISFNPAPMNDDVFTYPLNLVDLLIINEVEGYQLTQLKMPEDIVNKIAKQFPHINILLTLGEKGVLLYENGNMHTHQAYKANVVDTTAAGDTFIGYFLSAYDHGYSYQQALTLASIASSLCVSRLGATSSIPPLEEVLANPYWQK